MLYLQELFDDLAYGEFANMAVGKNQVTTIDPDKYPRIVSLVNAGLLDLYTKFPMKEKILNLHQRTGVDTYYLRPDHVGDPDGGDSDIYIDGTGVDPVNGDIIKITSAYDDEGEDIRINDNRYPDDIFTPEQDVIKITPGDTLKILSLVYKASYPRILIPEGFDPETLELNFPRFLKPALLAFMASRFFIGKTSQAAEGQPNLSNTFLYRYNTELEVIRNNSLAPHIDPEAAQFERAGWV